MLRQKVAGGFCIWLAACALTACGGTQSAPLEGRSPGAEYARAEVRPESLPRERSPRVRPQWTKETVQEWYGGVEPLQWGESLEGVYRTLPAEGEKTLFLTFDACGGERGGRVDTELLAYLEEEQIKATLFLNSRWIESNTEQFMRLAESELFCIGNHGTRHCPLSVNGRSVYGIHGTESPEEVYEEVMGNHTLIERLTGKEPEFFRSGTAYYDEVAIAIAESLGERIIGFSILGDAGATFTKEQIQRQLQDPPSGSIVIFHMNQPRSDTCEGVKAVIPELREQGYQFSRLDEADWDT